MPNLISTIRNFLSPEPEIPDPPPIPKYDPSIEVPKWSWTKLSMLEPIEKDPKKPWTRTGTRPESDDMPDWRGVIRNQVIEVPHPKPYECGLPIDRRYYWFDTPDYADPFKKLWNLTRYSTLVGLLSACTVGFYKNLRFGVDSNLMLMRKFGFPGFMATMAGGSTVIILANLRGKKDDYWNYAGAGIAAGVIVGRNHYYKLVHLSVALVGVSLALKFANETNQYVLPRAHYRRGHTSKQNLTGEDGIMSGDLRFGFRVNNPDPGRDLRRVY